MNWNPHLEAHHLSTSYPYSSSGSFMEYVEGLTYDHVNFIFDGAMHIQSAFEEYKEPVTNPSSMPNEPSIEVNMGLGGNLSLRRHANGNDFQVVWQDTLDPDNMTYEELLELGETVGTQSRGLSQDLISLLPVTKYKCSVSLFTRKKSGKERCVICQMEYKRRERLITLPCKHAYHVSCGTKWLSINKACPICYAEAFGYTSKS
ncbi:PREDICTED: LOW QUALITY PROTEIN: E3 ubiquitin ligase BIG BROTHER-like [Tarenaya hassleriana]|uniref:LOW QUALITY PROTEIN: E3 ubiquitin ligase BIG BROTHER-like n=1 Tax=Tarenaya hassleriana TaxID=28532 RepID=UPI0008FD3113|nr:PREDICTED: LOW QUALITY PROTEIN: E3 ubiquitin ligase BIG BROTHER-like [Tarenaya hassleriana]